MRESNLFTSLRRTYFYENNLVPTTVSWEGYTPNLIQMQGYNTSLASFTSALDLALQF